MRRLLLCVVLLTGLGLVAGCCGGSNLCDWGGFPCGGSSAPASYPQ